MDDAELTSIPAAFAWVAWWETGGSDRLDPNYFDPDQSEQARALLGENAYGVIVGAARAWQLRQAALDASFDYEAGLDDVYRRAGLSRTKGGAP